MADENPKDPVNDYLAKLAEVTKALGENKEQREEFLRNLKQLAQTSSGFSPESQEAVRKALLETDAQKEAATLQETVFALGKNLDPLSHVGAQMREISEATKRLQELLQMTRAGKLGEISPDTRIGELWPLAERVKAAEQKRAAETNQVDDASANQWFREHWKDRRCAICQSVTWAMAPSFAHVPTSRLWRHAAATSFPCVVLTCRICGNTLFFNAVAMKLLPEGSE
jgi:hypothetical protein